MTVKAVKKENNIILNDDQKKAVDHVYGPCFVCACPGAGKTKTIVERVVNLIKIGNDPKKILCITFTNKAANEMKTRLHKRLGDRSKGLYASTFHAFCANILRKFGSSLGYTKSMTICDTKDSEDLMFQVSRKLGYNYSKYNVKGLVYIVNNLREELMDENSWVDNIDEEFIPFDKYECVKIMNEYVSKLRKGNSVDFSGLLSETIRLLKDNSDTKNILQNRFDFILADEMQDTNYAQFEIVKLIGLESHKNVFICADPDQSIYGWRGARYENISDFIDEYNPSIIKLSKNYRSTPEIVKAASNLIENNKNRQQMHFETDNASGHDVMAYSFKHPDNESYNIASIIKSMIEKNAYKEKDIAILYRLNSMARSIEVSLAKEGINYSVIGGLSFFERTEIKDLLSMLKFYTNPLDGIAFERFANKPVHGVGPAIIGKIENFAQENNIDIAKSLRRNNEYLKGYEIKRVENIRKKIDLFFDTNKKFDSIGKLLEHLSSSWDYLSYLYKKCDGKKKEYEDRNRNMKELIISSDVYSNKNGYDPVGYLNSISLSTTGDKDSPEGTVSLMTIHAAKGLEFPVIFMPRMESDMLPFERAVIDPSRPNGLEEERRLCYVGISRAKERLILSFPRSRPQSARNNYNGGFVEYSQTLPSQFFKEINILDKIIEI